MYRVSAQVGSQVPNFENTTLNLIHSLPKRPSLLPTRMVRFVPMSRRIPVCSVVFFVLMALAANNAQNFVDVKPSPQQVEWQDLEMGAIVHFGPNTFLDREWGDGTADPEVFNPTQFDPEQWMQALQSAGMNVIFVAKHHDGSLV